MAKLSTYTHKSYDGGLNDTDDKTEIGRDQASLLRNWDITHKGRLTKRDGLTIAGTFTRNPSASETITLSGAVTVSIS